MEQIVIQNKDVITGKLQVEMNNLTNLSKQIEIIYKVKYETPENSTNDALFIAGIEAAVRDFFLDIDDIRTFIACRYPDTDTVRLYDYRGLSVDFYGELTDIGGREYFKTAYAGTPNVSERMTSKLNGDDIFAISVPMIISGKIVGTVQRSFTAAEMDKLCAISPQFAGRGFTTIVYKDGYIVFTTEPLFDNLIKEVNFFSKLREHSPRNGAAADKMEKDLFLSSEPFIDTVETVVNSKRYFSAYTPMEQIHNWYLITSVEVKAVAGNSSQVIVIFYIILLSSVFIFGLIMMQFMSLRNEQRRRLENLAYLDPVTGGNTLNKFLEHTRIALAKPETASKTYGVLSFDIDNFKYINGYYGYSYGNNVLKNVYQAVSSKLEEDEILARTNGDHFVALLSDSSVMRAKKLIQVESDTDAKLYISAGLYMVTDRAENINLMLDKAKMAAEKVKGRTYDKVMMYSLTNDLVNKKNERMKRRVDEALLYSEFIPFYQPKIDINTGELVGSEALARWQKSDGLLISPADFIPLCERTGQIVEIDNMIFEKVLQFLKKQLQDGLKSVPVSVNFSRLHFFDEDFISNIFKKIEEYQVPADLIQIELTESVIFENKQTINDLVRDFHNHGMMVCMDDFGSGYSSLNMLKDVDVDVLKIDKGFIDETMNSDRRNTILSAITTMAKNLHMEIVVEGVETEENVSLMKDIGCSIAQGFFYAKPMSEAEFYKLFKDGCV